MYPQELVTGTWGLGDLVVARVEPKRGRGRLWENQNKPTMDDQGVLEVKDKL